MTFSLFSQILSPIFFSVFLLYLLYHSFLGYLPYSLHFLLSLFFIPPGCFFPSYLLCHLFFLIIFLPFLGPVHLHITKVTEGDCSLGWVTRKIRTSEARANSCFKLSVCNKNCSMLRHATVYCA